MVDRQRRRLPWDRRTARAALPVLPAMTGCRPGPARSPRRRPREWRDQTARKAPGQRISKSRRAARPSPAGSSAPSRRMRRKLAVPPSGCPTSPAISTGQSRPARDLVEQREIFRVVPQSAGAPSSRRALAAVHKRPCRSRWGSRPDAAAAPVMAGQIVEHAGGGRHDPVGGAQPGHDLAPVRSPFGRRRLAGEPPSHHDSTSEWATARVGSPTAAACA